MKPERRVYEGYVPLFFLTQLCIFLVLLQLRLNGYGKLIRLLVSFIIVLAVHGILYRTSCVSPPTFV